MTSAAPLVAVAGGTSKQGRSVVRMLLADGRFRVRAFTRDPSSPQVRGTNIFESSLTTLVRRLISTNVEKIFQMTKIPISQKHKNPSLP